MSIIFLSKFPTLPSQSPINPTPPSTLYSGTQDFLAREQTNNPNNQVRAVKRILNSSHGSLFNEDEEEAFLRFVRNNKRNKLTDSWPDHYMDDDNISSSVHLQLTSSHNDSESRSLQSNHIHLSNNQSAESMPVTNDRTNPQQTKTDHAQNQQHSIIIVQPSEENRSAFFSSRE